MIRLLPGDALEQLRLMPDESVHCCVTSPPYYGLRDYGMAGQIGLEPSPDAYVAALVAVFRDVRRVLRQDGTLWVNIGDSYAANRSYQVSDNKHKAHDYGGSNALRVPAGLKQKDLLGIPWMLAFALRADGWWLRQDIIWSKPNPMPESVTDRCTKAHEYLFLLSKSARYWFDAAAIAEPCAESSIKSHANRPASYTGPRTLAACPPWHPAQAHPDKHHNGLGNGAARDLSGRNKRSVWTVASEPFAEAHFATFPPALIEPAILAGCPRGGAVLDPFGGAGTTGLAADRLGRNAILIELNPAYCTMIRTRITNDAPLFVEFANAAN